MMVIAWIPSPFPKAVSPSPEVAVIPTSAIFILQIVEILCYIRSIFGVIFGFNHSTDINI